MTKSFNSLQLNAIELLAGGASEVEVCNQVKRSKSWLQRCKRDENFILAVEQAKARNQVVLQQALDESKKKQTQQQVAEWAERREEIRRLEWDCANKLFAKSLEILALPLEKTRYSLADAHSLADSASKLSRKAAELWDKDLNAAIALVQQYGYEIRDARDAEIPPETKNPEDNLLI
ncbi:MAG: hypothetical protein KME46_34060 [Brasilonema angustatum HA4187-MV1]|jgi:regulator of replication initiation timing|nr:hypothetical protein [Brasilonema angustatum HA4187-MV1]